MNNNFSLYQLNGDFQCCLSQAIDEETGEIKDEKLLPLLNNLKLALVDKAQNIVFVLNSLSDREKNIDREIERLETLKSIAKNNHEKLKNYLANNIPQGQKIETDLIKISWRKSESVEITDITKLQPEYIKTKVEESPDKTKIKEAIKSGKKVKGAKLIEKQNIQIK